MPSRSMCSCRPFFFWLPPRPGIDARLAPPLLRERAGQLVERVRGDPGSPASGSRPRCPDSAGYLARRGCGSADHPTPPCRSSGASRRARPSSGQRSTRSKTQGWHARLRRRSSSLGPRRWRTGPRTSEIFAHINPKKMQTAIRFPTKLWKEVERDFIEWSFDHSLAITGDNKILIDLRSPKRQIFSAFDDGGR